MYPAFAADAGKSHTSERSAEIAQKPAIDPGDSGAEFFGDAVAALEIRGPDRSCQPVLRAVRFGDGLFFGIERRDVANGAEDFLLHAARRFRQPGENRGLHVKAGVASIAEFWDSAAGDHRRALFARQLIVGKNLVG